MNRLIIIGAGGHGKVIADNALKNGYTDIGFIDDNLNGECFGFAVVGTVSQIETFNDGKTDFVIGIGNNEIRKNIAERFNVNWVTLVHPSAQIGMSVSIDKGTVVMAGAVINVCATVGKHCIINSNAIVEHDNVIGDFVHISPGVALGGTVNIGRCSHIGLGATVINNTSVCHNCVIGAGSVVVKNISESGKYVGIPARNLKKSGAV